MLILWKKISEEVKIILKERLRYENEPRRYWVFNLNGIT